MKVAKFKEKFISSLPPTFIILVFIILKWSSLFQPYFWDEAWSYIPAITQMANNTPCLVPGCINVDLYRGHPLLFYFISSIWMKYISNSLFSMHLFALLISIFTLITFHNLTKIFLNTRWQLFSLMLFTIQEVFFVQSMFVLPEIFIVFLTLEMIRSYLLKKDFISFICAALLGLTKEIGIIIISSFIILNFFYNRDSKLKSLWLLAALVPASLFFLIQKIKYGWYFYPTHIDLLSTSLIAIKSKLAIVFKFLFIEQGRKLIIALLFCLALVNMLFKNIHLKWVHISLILFGAFCLFFVNHLIIYLILILFIFIYVIKVIDLSFLDKKIFILFAIVSVLLITFSSINFLMLRYLLLMIPLIILMFSILMQKHFVIARNGWDAIFIFLVGMFLYCSIYNYKFKNWHDDVSSNYINVINVHKEAIKYCESEMLFDKKILTHFLMYVDLTNINCGYLSSDRIFSNTRYNDSLKNDDQVVIISNVEYDEGLQGVVKNNSKFILNKRFECHMAWCEIYTLK